MNSPYNKLASDLAAQQVAGFDGEVQRIDEQIRQLQARREAVLIMRQTMEPLAKRQPPPAKVDPVKQAGTASVQGSTGPGPTTVMTTPVAIAPGTGALGLNGSVAKVGTGFADAVRAVLKDCPKGMKPKAVAEQMKVRGSAATYTGKTQFAVRVGNELYRLLKAGEVGRRAGRYFLAPPHQEQPP